MAASATSAGPATPAVPPGADGLLFQVLRRSGHWPAVYAVTALAGAVVELLLPAALGEAVDDLVGPAALLPDAGTAAGLTIPSGALLHCLLLVTVLVACDAVAVFAAGAGGAQAARLLRLRVVRHLLGAGPAVTRRFSPGDLVTRAGANTDEVGTAPESIITAVALLVPAAGSLVALALIDIWPALAFAAGLALVALVLRAFLHGTTAAAGGYQQAQSDIAARLIDALSGARTIAAAGTEEREVHRVLAPLARLRTHGMALWRVNARAGVQAALAVPLLEIAVIGVSGVRLAAGEMSTGELFAAARYAVLGAGIGAALGQLNRLGRARSAARRVREVLGHPVPAYGEAHLPATGDAGRRGTAGRDAGDHRNGVGKDAAHRNLAGRDVDDPRPLSSGLGLPTGAGHAERGRLELRDVTVRVDGRPALRGVSLTVPGGAALAVVGRSGSGKSLLAAVAGRLVDPDEGEVLLDGMPLPRLAHDALREAVGYAFERPVLFGATIGEAIAVGRPDGAARAAARAAAADPFVRRLPRSYDTLVDDAPMSGGERQRIGLARAFAHGGRLLILDDATSSLDTVTEYQVARALTEELRDRTRLIVAHRAATAARADLVVWLEEGQVKGRGTHQALWRDPGYRAVFTVAAAERE
ncbi:ABC transporter ATP-binding protein [Sphaerisporangium melleum]|uniref:ABC transporter ATP-binding protein n=1 Tax=Sphaerisporangium melleum TaxID=321316 RepID=A0A917R4P5_9ACTN|nr:ABC transporter ATP-binding protein [Sphaerisporangium melleum]GGK90570.1 ABC transporter ATP-binding protein [Sphaerisporangium melleum]GII72847.1 ABC transporter ATP-binding protein [Sphaerisporangium melleum]